MSNTAQPFNNLLDALMHIRDKGSVCTFHGICYSVVKLTNCPDIPSTGIYSVFKRMGYDPIYPLGSAEYHLRGNMWEGERGDKRKALLNECIALLESDLKQP